MKPKTTMAYQRILNYLKNKVSKGERHAVEKELMRDIFEYEAFEGLNSIKPIDLEFDMELLQQKIKERTIPQKSYRLNTFIKIAASIIVLLGISLTIRLSFKNKADSAFAKQIAQEQKKLAPVRKQFNIPLITNEPEQSDSPETFKEKNIINQLITGREPEESVDEIAGVESEKMIPFEREELKSMDKVSARKPVIKPKSIDKAKAKRQASQSLRGEIAGMPVYGSNFSNHSFKGIVTDTRGQPLPGVTILEKGTSNGAISDISGAFELKLGNSGSTLEVKSLGYVTEEITANNIKNGKIELSEDIVAAEDVVVVGYGTQKKSDAAGTIFSVTADNSELMETQTIFAKPPTGNYISYKKYIYKNLNYSEFADVSEKQKLVVEFTVFKNGSVGYIKFGQPADPRICDEIKRVIKTSGRWTPEIKNNVIVDSQVKMRLTIEPVNKGE